MRVAQDLMLLVLLSRDISVVIDVVIMQSLTALLHNLGTIRGTLSGTF